MDLQLTEMITKNIKDILQNKNDAKKTELKKSIKQI